MSIRRRTAIAAAACAGAWLGGARASGMATPFRIGLTPVFLDNQVAFLNDWRGYLQARLQRRVQFVQRGSYGDVVALMQQGQLDFAWLCGYPYVRNAHQLRLVGVPLYRGQPLYRSYLIVPVRSSAVQSMLDLRGSVFAYSDPDSNSGHLYPLHTLLQMGQSPRTFFARTFFTWGHRKVVDAVGVGLAGGGAVDGYVWDTLALLHPETTVRTRVVQRSPAFGFPPFVARASVAGADLYALQSVLVAMASDDEGRSLLRRLNLDGFTPGRPELYDGVRAMSRLVDSA